MQRAVGNSFNPGETLNVVQMMAGTADLFEPTVRLVRAISAAEGIDPKVRQMIILRAATVLEAPYEWQANVPLSLNNGLSRAEVDAAASDGSVTGVAEEHRLACQATDELSGTGTLTDETLKALLDWFGEVTTRKLILVIAWFNLLSLFLTAAAFHWRQSTRSGTRRRRWDSWRDRRDARGDDKSCPGRSINHLGLAIPRIGAAGSQARGRSADALGIEQPRKEDVLGSEAA